MNDELDIDDIKAPEQAPPLEDLSIAVQHGDVLPRKALVDSKWVAALKSVVKQAKGLVIKDAPSLQLAVNLQSRLTEARKQITKSHDDLKAPYLAAGRAIDEAVKAPYAEIDAAVEVLRKLQVDFANAERDRVARVGQTSAFAAASHPTILVATQIGGSRAGYCFRRLSLEWECFGQTNDRHKLSMNRFTLNTDHLIRLGGIVKPPDLL